MVESTPDIVLPNPGQYILGEYARKWYAGNVIEISAENRDARVDFMEDLGQLPSLLKHGQQKGKCGDKCWVPFVNILMVINIPTTASSYGHQYHLDKDDIQKVFNPLMTGSSFSKCDFILWCCSPYEQ